jgi:hypothetical protein
MNMSDAIPDAGWADTLCAHLRSCEEALLDPAVRRDRARVAALLSENFEEFGSSGRVWSREAIIDSLATEDYEQPKMEDFKCLWIAEGVVLVTYRTVKIDSHSSRSSTVLRSSIWIKELGEWRVRFHQGTKEAQFQGSTSRDG